MSVGNTWSDGGRRGRERIDLLTVSPKESARDCSMGKKKK